MNKTFKVFKFELYKTLSNTFMVISFLLFFCLFMGVIILGAYTTPSESQHALSSEAKSEIIEDYIVKRETIGLVLDYMNGKADNLPDGVLIWGDYNLIKKEYEYYDYLIKTDSIASEYVWIALNSYTAGHLNVYVMYVILKALCYLLPLLSIFTAFYVLNLDIGGDVGKTLIASPLTRRQIFGGKMLFLLFINIVLFLFSIIIPACLGGTAPMANVLLYGENGYYAQSAFTFIFPLKITTILFSMLFYTMVSALFSMFIKKRFWALTAPLTVFGTAQLLFFALFKLSDSSINTIYKILPLSFLKGADFNLISNLFCVLENNWIYLIIASVICMLFFTLATYICGKKFLKRDF